MEYEDLPVCVRLYLHYLARNRMRFFNLSVSQVADEIVHLSYKCLMKFYIYIKNQPKESPAIGLRHCHPEIDHPYIKLEKALARIKDNWPYFKEISDGT